MHPESPPMVATRSSGRSKSEAPQPCKASALTPQELAAALDNIPSAVAIYDAGRTLRFWNRQFEELLGLDRALHRGMTFREVREAVADAASFDKDERTTHIESRMSSALLVDQDTIRLALADERCIEIVQRAIPSGGWMRGLAGLTPRRHTPATIRAATDPDARPRRP